MSNVTSPHTEPAEKKTDLPFLRRIEGMFDGSIYRLFFRLGLPIFTGMFALVIYFILNTFWIGRIDPGDPSYVAGTGLVYPIIFFMIALGAGIQAGVASLVARSIGRKNHVVLDRTAESALIMAVTISSFVLLFGYIFDEEIVSVLGARDLYLVRALEFYRYVLPALFFLIVGNVFSGILLGEGQVKRVMVAMIIMTVSNMALDPVLIFWLGLGLRGAGLATVCAQFLTFCYLFQNIVLHKTVIRPQWKLKNVDGSIIVHIFTVALPQMTGQMIMSISVLVYNRLLFDVDKLGLTAFTICTRFEQLIYLPLNAIAAALVTIIGQNYGRGRFERVKMAWRTAILLSLYVVIIIASILFVLAPRIYPFFTDLEEVVRWAVLQTRVTQFALFFAGIGVLSRAFYQSIGEPLPAMVISLLRLAVIAIPLAFFLVYVMDFGVPGVWLGIMGGNGIVAGIVMLWVRNRVKRMIACGAHGPKGAIPERDVVGFAQGSVASRGMSAEDMGNNPAASDLKPNPSVE